MNVSKQVILGVAVLFGGLTVLYGTINQIMTSDAEQAQQTEKTDKIATKTPIEQPQENIISETVSNSDNNIASGVEMDILSAEENSTIVDKSESATNTNAEEDMLDDDTVTTNDAISYPVVTPRTTSQVNNNVQNNNNSSNNQSVTTKTVTAKSAEPVQRTPEKTTVKTTTNNPPVQQTLKNSQTKTDNTPVKVETKTQPKPVVQETHVKKTQQSTTEKTKATQTKTEKTDVRPTTYQVKRGEGLIVLSRRFDVPVEILAQFNNLKPNTVLNVGQNLNIPTVNDVQKLQKQLAEQERQRQQEIEQKQRYQEAQAKLKDARQTVKETDAKGIFGVQVALATDEAKAQEIVKKLTEAGYKVKTSPTTRGIRIVVGPETGKVAALALKDKINNDPRIPIDNAWVLYW